jgi:8-oxo-dGTP pyrophosphatase MutT (NUDIX family)
MEFPGGQSDLDEDPIKGVVRETEEETGLFIEPDVSPIFAERRLIKDGKYKGLTYRALYWHAKIISGKIKLSIEHNDYTWKSLDEALELDLTPGSRKVLKAIGRTALKDTKQDNNPPNAI